MALNHDYSNDDILERIAEGVLVLGPDLKPILTNRAAARMLGFQGGTLPRRLPSEDVLNLARRVARTNVEIEQVITTWFPLRQNLKAKVSRLPDGRSLVILQDVTEEELAQRVRREFVAHASHELKSPVAGIQALAEALLHAVDEDPVSATRFAERIVGESERLGRLISDLLDLSRLEDPARKPDESVPLSELAVGVFNEVVDEAEGRSVAADAQIEPDLHVRGDDKQLAVMIRNLLDNAIRYTPDEGKVLLSVARHGATAEVRVVDDGIGIPRAAQARVFERFYRVDRARSRDKGGTGLGLAIVKHVVELHGGTIDVQSEVGSGTTFTARLPLLLRDDPRSQTG